MSECERGRGREGIDTNVLEWMFSRSFINSFHKMTPWVLVTPRKQYSMRVPTWKLYLSSGEIAGTSSIRNSPTSTRLKFSLRSPHRPSSPSSSSSSFEPQHRSVIIIRFDRCEDEGCRGINDRDLGREG